MSLSAPQSLYEAVKKSPSNLGENLEHLGKAGFFSSKSYISFTETGFKIINLNIFQRILRKIFGFFTDTHSKFVLTFINYEENKPQLEQSQKELCKKLSKKFHDIILKKYSNETCPFIDWRRTCPSWIESHNITFRIMKMIKPYFLSAYKEGFRNDRKTRNIDGVTYTVERANHALAHGLRQGALAKDIFDLLINYKNLSDSSGIVNWAHRKISEDPEWLTKIEIASSFQRSGRQSEVSSASNLELYKKYEMQDVSNFKQATKYLKIFKDASERNIFAEAILWSNPGTLDENKIEDLKYLRRILHSAHTLDLRRCVSFDGNRIKQDALKQLFDSSIPSNSKTVINLLWRRSGEYLDATGDRDLVSKRDYQDKFFTQTKKPLIMSKAIRSILEKSFF